MKLKQGVHGIDITETNYTLIKKLEAWSTKRDHSLADLAETWLLALPSVCSVISGATRVE